MTYQPRPVDTKSVVLGDDLLRLAELLSRNTHEVWAVERIRLGWTYGARRDDPRREHPGLVPYDELPEAEKQFDRNTTLEVLKAMVALGYRIQPPDPRT